MSCDLERVLRDFCGAAVPGGFTKAAVMAALRRPQDALARFSKYSGVVEWRNAVVLWVNVGGADYKNQFLDGGRKMTWFAGSKHEPETPVIKRLLALGDADVAGKQGGHGGGGDEALLLCRVQPGPYVCCGRVRIARDAATDLPEAHDPRRRPLKFVLRLLDHDTMLGREQKTAKAKGGGTGGVGDDDGGDDGGGDGEQDPDFRTILDV